MSQKQLQEAATAALAVRRIKGESLEEIAKEIVMISNAIRKLLSESVLKEETILLLIQNAIPTSANKYRKMSIRQIKIVLEGIQALESTYLKPRDEQIPENHRTNRTRRKR